MPNNHFGPVRDESLHRAAQRILKILEREEMAKRRALSPTASVPLRAQLAHLSNQVPLGFHPDRYLASDDDDPGGSADLLGSGVQMAQAVPMPGPTPIPFPLPPIANPASKENEEWVRWASKLLRDLGRALSGGGPDCGEQWKDARRTCVEELAKPNPNRGITGGYTDTENCARGLVSEECGGNKVDRGPSKRRKPWGLK
jgi:hypothetical protein